MQQGLLRRHSNSIKPHLTDANKAARLQWCVDMLEHGSLHDDPKFKGLFDHVFIDEKWFFLTKKSEKYYLLPDEDDPIVLARARISSLGSCFGVYVLGQGLATECVLLMGRLAVSLLLLMDMLKEIV